MNDRTRESALTMTDPIRVWGAPEGWDAFLLAQRRREYSGPILHVTRDDARMARLAEALAFAMPEAEIRSLADPGACVRRNRALIR